MASDDILLMAVYNVICSSLENLDLEKKKWLRQLNQLSQLKDTPCFKGTVPNRNKFLRLEYIFCYRLKMNSSSVLER